MKTDVKHYVIRLPGGYWHRELGARDPVPLALATVCPEAVESDSPFWPIGPALVIARAGHDGPPIEVWAIEVELRAVDGRPAFAIGADSGGGE